MLRSSLCICLQILLDFYVSHDVYWLWYRWIKEINRWTMFPIQDDPLFPIWDYTHVQFIELIEKDIQKGNKPWSFINKKGWKNLVKSLNQLTGKYYDNKQLKNHRDSMKKEWTVFKQLMQGEWGLGWDERNKTFAANNDLWEQKIKVFPFVLHVTIFWYLIS